MIDPSLQRLLQIGLQLDNLVVKLSDLLFKVQCPFRQFN